MILEWPLASGTRADNITQARRLLDVPAAQPEAGETNGAEANEPKPLSQACPCCGGRMIIIDTFLRAEHHRQLARLVNEMRVLDDIVAPESDPEKEMQGRYGLVDGRYTNAAGR
jgi:hypothetical protein